MAHISKGVLRGFQFKKRLLQNFFNERIYELFFAFVCIGIAPRLKLKHAYISIEMTILIHRFLATQRRSIKERIQ